MIKTIPVTVREFDLAQVLMNGLKTLDRWQDRAAQRRRLGEMDSYILADIGISPAQAKAEARKPFWWY